MRNRVISSLCLMFSFWSVSAAAISPGDVCGLIYTSSTTAGLECVKVISQPGTLDSNATNFCGALARYSVDAGLSCMKAIYHNAFQADAVQACNLLISTSPQVGLDCITAVASKSYYNGAALACFQIAQLSVGEGIACFQSSGLSVAPRACPRMTDVATKIGLAIVAISTGLTKEAVTQLQTLQSQIASCP